MSKVVLCDGPKLLGRDVPDALLCDYIAKVTTQSGVFALVTNVFNGQHYFGSLPPSFIAFTRNDAAISRIYVTAHIKTGEQIL